MRVEGLAMWKVVGFCLVVATLGTPHKRTERSTVDDLEDLLKRLFARLYPNSANENIPDYEEIEPSLEYDDNSEDNKCTPNPNSQQRAELYALKHPNLDTAPNPEYGKYFEGDILISRDQLNSLRRNPFNAVADRSRLWPDGIMYYEIDSAYNESQKLNITAAMSDLENLTKVNGRSCIKIQPKTNNDSNGYVSVQKGDGCASPIGYQGKGRNILTLGDGCVTIHGTIMHEFLHAFGFFHEHTRSDRDKYVIINKTNIITEYMNNFEKRGEDTNSLQNTPYDYCSVMHYEAFAFPIDPSIRTITPRNEDAIAVIGQRRTLSAIDIERVQLLYSCKTPANSRFYKHLQSERLA